MNDIEYKTCIKCGGNKRIDLFGYDKRIKSGRSGSCKSCIKVVVQSNAKNNAAHIHQRTKNYYYDNQESILDQKKEYIKNISADLRANRNRALKRHFKKHPKRESARAISTAAIRSGKLLRPGSCSTCDKSCKPEAHHDDYKSPLDVRWLCKRCHSSWHANNKTID